MTVTLRATRRPVCGCACVSSRKPARGRACIERKALPSTQTSEVRERKRDRREMGQQHRVPRTLVLLKSHFPNLTPWPRSAGRRHRAQPGAYDTKAGLSQQACPAPRGSSETPTSFRRSWTKRRSVSLCRPVRTLTLQISSDAHTRARAHTHSHSVPASPCGRCG